MEKKQDMVAAVAAMHPVTLDFERAELERAFQENYARWIRPRVRAASLLVLFLFVLFGFLDPWLAPEYNKLIWGIRGVACLVMLGLLGYAFSSQFAAHNQMVLACTCVFLGIAHATIISFSAYPGSYHYYPALILLVVGTYELSGLRFVYALVASTLIILVYELQAVVIQDAPLYVLMVMAFFLLAAHLVGAFAGYVIERQKRAMFYQSLVIDEERQAIEQLAVHDRLTGLPNRILFEQRAEQALARARRFDALAAVLFVDIDRFKPINDTYGHHVGDLVLREITGRLKGCMRASDTLARFGGDEFLALVEDLKTPGDALAIGEKFLQMLQAPMTIQDGEPITCTVGASIGISVYPHDGRLPEELIRQPTPPCTRSRRAAATPAACTAAR